MRKKLYFCKKIKDYLISFITNIETVKNVKQDDYYKKFITELRSKFIGTFGTTKHMDPFTIKYLFGKHKIDIVLSAKNDKGYIRFYFDSLLRTFIADILKEYYGIITEASYNQKSILDIFGTNGLIENLKRNVRERVFNLSIVNIDLTMQEFIEVIRNTKTRFGAKIIDMLENYRMTSISQYKSTQVLEACDLVKRILHAEYINDTDGEKMYFDQNHWVKLMFGSSGQQEALWIVMLSFAIILENRKYFVVVEEPEAHLFPEAQFEIMKLLSLLISSTNSQVIVTTHSPYILSSANALLLPSSLNKKNSSYMPKMFRLDCKKCSAYSLHKPEECKGKTFIRSIIDENSRLLNFDYIDSISSGINELIDRIMAEE